MAKNNVLDELASFDLNAPINVTVLIEENDDNSVIIENNCNEKTNPEICKTTTYTHNRKDSTENNRGCNQNKWDKQNSTNHKSSPNKELIEILNAPAGHQRAFDIAIAEMEKVLNVHLVSNDIDGHNVLSSSKQQVNFEINTKKRLLFQVSMYLVNIITEFRKNVQSLQQTTDQREIALLKRIFLDKKYYFFNLARNTVETLILPRLNNGLIAKFCEVTHNWTKYWNVENIRSDEIIFIFKELITWVKETSNLHFIKTGNRHNINQQVSNQPKELTLFNDGPVGHEIKISYQPPHTSVKQTNPKQNNMQDNRCSMFNQSDTYSLTKQPPPPAYQNIHTHHNNLKRNYYHQTSNVPVVQMNQLDAFGNPLYVHSRELNTVPDSQRDKTATSFVHKVHKPPPQMQQFIANNNIAENLFTYEEMSNTKKIKTASNPSLKVIEPTRSCVSTDSGIMSPINFEEMTSTHSTPTITHVTSLSPYAVQRQESQCFVCSKITKNKCLGCCSRYYCCSLCQEIDWDKHKSFCFHQTALRSRV